MVISWNAGNRTFDVENDGVARFQLDTDDAVPRLSAHWTDLHLEADLAAPYFRTPDIVLQEQEQARLASAELKGYASLVFVKFTPPVTVRDGLVEMQNANVTMRMHS
jgi:hypothetical protein